MNGLDNEEVNVYARTKDGDLLKKESHSNHSIRFGMFAKSPIIEHMEKYNRIFENNQKWIEEKKATDAEFFEHLSKGQDPDFIHWMLG